MATVEPGYMSRMISQHVYRWLNNQMLTDMSNFVEHYIPPNETDRWDDEDWSMFDLAMADLGDTFISACEDWI